MIVYAYTFLAIVLVAVFGFTLAFMHFVSRGVSVAQTLRWCFKQFVQVTSVASAVMFCMITAVQPIV